MAYTERELLARLIQCEAGGEGEDGMRAVASVIMNRATVPYGEFFRISQGGNVRNIIEQPGQFVCMRETVNGNYNQQNVWNMDPQEIHYEIADWALAGNTLGAVGESLFFFNALPIFPLIFRQVALALHSIESMTTAFTRLHKSMQPLESMTK